MLLNTNGLGTPSDNRKKKNGKKNADKKIEWTMEDTKRVAMTAIILVFGTVGIGYLTLAGQTLNLPK